MAYNPTIRMSLKNEAGLYYTALLNYDGTWSVSTSAGAYYITLPEKWEDSAITWMRDPNYLGIFRSMSSNANYSFSGDARAIIQYISNTEGLKGFATLVTEIADGYSYNTFFETQLDFKTYSDNLQNRMLTIATLDSGLIRDIHAYGDTKYNIPMWTNVGSEDTPEWVANDTFFVLHDGIKLLYSASYISSATETDPLDYSSVADGQVLVGYNRGQFGTGTHEGYHTIPAMNQYNIVQNNGTTTYIGNTILQPFLIQGSQHGALSAQLTIGSLTMYCGEKQFWGANNSQPYSRNNNILNNQLRSNTDLYINVVADFIGNISQFACGHTRINPYLGFAVFEIGEDDKPLIVSLGGGDSGMVPHYLYKFPLSGNGTSTATSFAPSNINVIEPITINYNKAYIFALIYDDDIGMRISDAISSLKFSKLQISLLSKYDKGESGTPIPAPYFPPSVMAAFRLHTLLGKLLPNLATRTTDKYGFPEPVTTSYTGVSTYLSDPSATSEGDAVPYQTAWTSSYCMQNLEGQSFVTVSLNDLFSFCKKVFGCGAYVLGNNFYIEKLSTIFDSSTMILDLGYDVAEFEIMENTEGVAANLKLGYAPADVNSNFGVDSFNTQLYFNTPASVIPGTMNYEEGGVMIDQYQIELARSQRVSQPIGSAIAPGNPSRDNQNIVLYCQPAAAAFTLPDTPTYPETCQMYTPSGSPLTVRPYQLTMRDGTIYPGVPCAQSTDPTAATAPYIYNLYYPDRAINVELSPVRTLNRGTGAFIHSVLDNMDSDYLAFRNTYIMQYNNTTLAIPSIESNLQIGSGSAGLVKEFADRQVGDLPTKLFRNKRGRVKSKYPVNMYSVLNTNPNGYMRFYWKEPAFGWKEYRMFIDRAVYLGATKGATEFTGRFVPTQTF